MDNNASTVLIDEIKSEMELTTVDTLVSLQPVNQRQEILPVDYVLFDEFFFEPYPQPEPFEKVIGRLKL
jgi:hypothetical protein